VVEVASVQTVEVVHDIDALMDFESAIDVVEDLTDSSIPGSEDCFRVIGVGVDLKRRLRANDEGVLTTRYRIYSVAGACLDSREIVNRNLLPLIRHFAEPRCTHRSTSASIARSWSMTRSRSRSISSSGRGGTYW